MNNVLGGTNRKDPKDLFRLCLPHLRGCLLCAPPCAMFLHKDLPCNDTYSVTGGGGGGGITYWAKTEKVPNLLHDDLLYNVCQRSPKSYEKQNNNSARRRHSLDNLNCELLLDLSSTKTKQKFLGEKKLTLNFDKFSSYNFTKNCLDKSRQISIEEKQDYRRSKGYLGILIDGKLRSSHSI